MMVTDDVPRASGRFVPGHSYSAETQIKPGHHLSPHTEFKRGQPAHNKLTIGSVRIRREANTGLYRAWVKVEELSLWKKRAVLVWEYHNGPLPNGWVVHHDDRNSLNDDIANLIGMSRRDHAAEHRDELNMSRRAHA